MFNPYHSEPAKIVKIISQTDNIKLFRFEFTQKVWGYNFSFEPGQIIELSLPGFGEAPFAPCSAPPHQNWCGGAPDAKYLELCVRNTGGRLTKQLHALRIGDKVGIRGPYGVGWPKLHNSHPERSEGSPANAGFNLASARDSSAAPRNDTKIKNVLIVVGGLGLVPLRTLILGKDKFWGKDAKIQIFYGAKTPEEFLFRDEFDAWRKNGVEIDLTVDKECVGWNDCVGMVTTLFDKCQITNNTQAFLCGPPIMYKFVLEKLKNLNISDENIFLSLERRMHCGIGVCQHCAVGSYYTCKDGPIFSWAQIKDIPGAI